MIKEAALGTEIVVSAPNKKGLLAHISKVVAEKAINVEGVAGYVDGKDAKIMIMTDDVTRASEALENSGYKSIKKNEVVVVDLENKVGALKGLAARLAEQDIDISYAYGTVPLASCPARLILSTTNNKKAIVALKK